MRIDRVEVRHVTMPLLYPWRTASHEIPAIDSLLIKLTSGELEAWAESCPFGSPDYSPEYAGGAFAMLRDWLAPAVVGAEIDSGELLQERLSHYKGNYFAKAALDVAWWVLEARRVGQPLHALLGGRREWVEVGADFGVMDSLDDLVAAVDDAVSAGFRRVKLKFRPGWDIDMLEAVRSTFPDITAHIDCNAAFRLSDLDLFRAVDRFDLAMIEQPLQHDDLLDHAKLQAQIDTPVCLDESIVSVRRAEQAVELGSCQYVNVKPGRVGGLTVARSIHDLCRDAGIPCWVGGMLESGVGAAICVALATLENFTYPSDIFPSSRFYAEDLAEPAVSFETSSDGGWHAVAGEGAGIAQAPKPDLLERLTADRFVIEAP